MLHLEDTLIKRINHFQILMSLPQLVISNSSVTPPWTPCTDKTARPLCPAAIAPLWETVCWPRWSLNWAAVLIWATDREGSAGPNAFVRVWKLWLQFPSYSGLLACGESAWPWGRTRVTTMGLQFDSMTQLTLRKQKKKNLAFPEFLRKKTNRAELWKMLKCNQRSIKSTTEMLWTSTDRERTLLNQVKLVMATWWAANIQDKDRLDLCGYLCMT